MRMLLRTVVASALLAAALAPRAARAGDSMDRSIVVLPIDTSKAGGKITLADRASLEEMLRDEAIDALQPLGWKVLSGENTIQLLQDNGIDPSKCDDSSCQLGIARQMTVPLFVSGTIQYTSDGLYTASFRLNDTKSGTPLHPTYLESPDLRGLREQFHKQAAEFFSWAPALKSAQASVPAVSEAHIGGQQSPLSLGSEEVIVEFDSTPPGAVVLADGQVLCLTTPCRRTLAQGSHAVSIQKEGYDPADTELVARKGAKVSLTLLRIAARVRVETTPPGLAIRADGKPAGTSPIAALELLAGPHEILVDDPCFVQEGERMVLKRGEDRTLRISPAPRLARLTVSADDESGNAVEARVRVDGQDVGTTPGSFKVSACSKRLDLTAGELSGSASLSLREGELRTVRVKLVKPAPPPAPPVSSAPASAEPSGPGFFADRKPIRYGFLLGTGAAVFQATGIYGAQTGWNWIAQGELSVYELFLAQLGGNLVSLNDTSGNNNFVYGGTGALGAGLLRGTWQPRAAFRFSAWGSSARAGLLEAGLRFAGPNFGVDFTLGYGVSGPVTWVAMASFAWVSAGSK